MHRTGGLIQLISGPLSQRSPERKLGTLRNKDWRTLRNIPMQDVPKDKTKQLLLVSALILQAVDREIAFSFSETDYLGVSGVSGVGLTPNRITGQIPG